MEWFRFYDEVLDDPKVQRLPAALFRDWINILCLCNRNDPRGVLPSIEDVAFGLRYTNAKAKGTIKKLHDADLLVTDQGVTCPNGWSKRQRVSDNVAERVAKTRAKKQAGNVTGNDTCNVTSNTTETLPHVRATETETDTEAELTTPSGVVEAQAPATPPDKPKAKRAMQVPETWMPSDGTRKWADGEGFTADQVNSQILRFVDHWRGKGDARKDWDATFRNWMRNAKEWGHLGQPPPSGNTAETLTTAQKLALQAERERAEYEQARSNAADGDSQHSLAERGSITGEDSGVFLGAFRRTG